MERADEVLALGVVHARLAAHAGVDLAEQAGRDGHPPDAAHVGGGDETRKVRDDASAEPHDDGAAVEPGLEHAVVQFAGPLERLGALAGGDDGDLDVQTGLAQALGGGVEVVSGDVLVGDERGLRAAARRLRLRPQGREEVRPDPDGVAETGELDVHLLHGLLPYSDVEATETPVPGERPGKS